MTGPDTQPSAGWPDARALAVARLGPGRIESRLAQSGDRVVDEGDRATETMGRLREEGFRFAVDDYGAGSCSLSHLQRHPVDLLKIDRAAIEEFGNDPRGNTLTRTILQMAESLELQTVAEGIETSSQLRELRRFGCDLGQGYLLSRPLEATELAQRFRQTEGVGVY